VIDHILQPKLYPDLYANISHVVRINYYPPRGDNKEGWDNIDIFGWLGYPMQIKVQLPVPRLDPRGPDRPRFFRAVHGLRTARRDERYPGVAIVLLEIADGRPEGLYPEHDLFIQLMKLKNTLRYTKGDELITHLGAEYYD